MKWPELTQILTEAVEQFAQESCEVFLLAWTERGQQFLLVVDVVDDDSVDELAAALGQGDTLRRLAGSVSRVTRLLATNRSIRLVMAPEVTMEASTRAPAVSR